MICASTLWHLRREDLDTGYAGDWRIMYPCSVAFIRHMQAPASTLERSAAAGY